LKDTAYILNRMAAGFKMCMGFNVRRSDASYREYGRDWLGIRKVYRQNHPP